MTSKVIRIIKKPIVENTVDKPISGQNPIDKKYVPALGYACINMSLKSKKICCNHTCRLATLESHYNSGGSPAVLKFMVDLALKNLAHLKTIIQWHIDNNMRFYRLSSDMFPHISQPKLSELLEETQHSYYQTLQFAIPQIEEIGLMAYNANIRLTMHPGQFNQLGSPTQSVVDNTFSDLKWQCLLLDIMENAINQKYDIKDSMRSSILCIHGGGVYDHKPTTIERWKARFRLLPDNVKRRIALENCEKSYCAEDVLPICKELGIPMIFDFHHYNCYSLLHPNITQKPISQLLPLILETWKGIGRPKFHLSDQAEGKMIGAHHDYVESIPDELLELMKSGYEFDIMIEAKMKDLAVFKLLEKYRNVLQHPLFPALTPDNTLSINA